MSFRSTLMAMSAALPLVLPVAASAQAQAQAQKIAYVDLQRILVEVEDGKAAKARLQKWMDDRQKEIDREQEALRKEKELLEKQAPAMSAQAREQKGAELQKKVMELAQKWERTRAEASNMERKEMEPIIRRIDETIARLAERDGLAFVLDKGQSGIIFARTQYDLSSEVIRAYNASRTGAQPPAKK